jgi:putative hydroxymethylpyrimidine transport system substrate-binding protein
MKKIILFTLSILLSINVAAETPQKLTVLLDWFPNPDHAPLIIAQQQGFFKEQGLDVELIGPADPTDPPKFVAAGKADIGISYEPEFMEQVDQGLPLVRIGTLIDKPLSSLVVLKTSGIQSLADLKGKRIGSSTSGLSSIMLKVMLAKAGLSEKEVELTNVRYNLTQALLSHRVDAVTGVMRNYEVPILESNDQHVVSFFPEENGIPVYSELVFIANTKTLQDNRYPRFLAAVKKAVRYLDEHPQQTWLDFAKQYPESNNVVNREAWFATMPYFAEDPASFDRKEWLQFANFMQSNQMIKKVQPISKYAVILR